MKVLIAVILSILVFVPSVLAHGAGASFEKEVGEYIVDIGYEPEEFVVGETASFSFELLDKKTRSEIEFDDIWVRLEKEKRTIFATGVSSGLNSAPTMLFTFPKEGEYVLFVRYQKNGEGIVEATFPITVEQQEQNLITPQLARVLILGIIVGGGGVFSFMFIRSKSKKEKPHKE